MFRGIHIECRIYGFLQTYNIITTSGTTLPSECRVFLFASLTLICRVEYEKKKRKEKKGEIGTSLLRRSSRTYLALDPLFDAEEARRT